MAPLITTDQVKAASPAELTSWTARLDEIIESASAACERYAARQFHHTTGETREFWLTGMWGSVQVGDLTGPPTAVSWTPHGGTTAPIDQSGWAVAPAGPGWPVSALMFTTPITGRGVLTVTGDWGFNDVPADVQEAVLDTVIRWMGAHPPADRPDDELGDTPPPSPLSYRARMLLAPYRRISVL